MTRHAIHPRALLVCALALFALLQPLAGTNGALGQSDEDCPEYSQAPLWISELTFDLAEGSPDSYVEGRVVFASPGDLIRVDFQVVNRVPEDCEDVFQLTGQPLDWVEVRRWLDGRLARFPGDPAPQAPGEWVAPDHPSNGACPSESLQEPGGTCNVTDFVRIPNNDTLAGQAAGEYRLRYVAGNGGGTWTALAGAERVLVVGARPDLTVESLRGTTIGSGPEPPDIVTTYGGGDTVGYKVEVTNNGTYPHWNPNGGPDLWGRSAFDGEQSTIKTCSELPCAVDGSKSGLVELKELLPRHKPVLCFEDGDENGDGVITSSERPNRLHGWRWCGDTDYSPGDNRYQSSHVWKFNTREVNYPRDDVEAPPCIGNDGSNRSSPWTDVTDTTDASDLICSYRRGARLEMPIAYNMTNADTGEAVQTGVTDVGTFGWNEDKDEAIVHDPENPSHTQTFDGPLFDSEHAAGHFQVTAHLAHQADGWMDGPEQIKTNNTATGPVNVHSVDLQLTTPSIFVEGPLGCGTTPQKPCPTNGKIILDASFENVGDERFDAIGLSDDSNRCDGWRDGQPSPRDRCWKAGAYLDGDLVEWDERGMNAISEQKGVPMTPNNTSATKIWSDSLHVKPDPEGGKQVVEVRLDPGTINPTPRPNGWVAEEAEHNECPEPGQAPDNVWCMPLYFEDATTPQVASLTVEAPRTNGTTPAVHEGETATLQANVTDNSLETVQARLALPNGTTETVEMNPGPDHEARWTATHRFTGVLGNVTYTVEAVDAYNHTTVSEEDRTLTVLELPKETTVERLQLNGHDITEDEGDPTYQGTPDDPDNWIRVEANVTGTGHADPWTTQGKTLTLHDATGQLRYELPTGVYTVCEIWNNVTDEYERDGRGDECDQSNEDETTAIRDRRPMFFVDTRCQSGSDPEPHAGDCQDVNASTRSAWRSAEIDWAGRFNVSVVATDVFNRTANETIPVHLTDADGPPTLENPAAQPSQLDPGDTLAASVTVRDDLRVERVHLEAVHPNGTVETYNLTLDPEETEDADSGNGTYTATLATGAFEPIDQAGTYELTLVAKDFAGNRNTTDPITVELTDDDTPTIASLTTVPNATQEAGGPITWQAEISDSTALRSPTLTVDKPAAGTQTYTLSQNASSGRYELPQPIETTEANVGTWTYHLRVEDHAGHVANATGSVDVVEQLPPQAIHWRPAAQGPDGATYGPPDPVLRVDVVDYGHGVNRTSIEMTVEGETVSPSIEPIEHGYRLIYDPGDEANLTHGDVVRATVSAPDLANPPLVAENRTHQFAVDAQPPTATLTLSPSFDKPDHRVVPPSAEVKVDVQDEHAGPGPATVRLSRTTDAMDPRNVTLDPGETVTLDAFDGAFGGHGPYTLTIEPTDAVGNTANQTTHTTVVDDNGPSVAVYPKPGHPRSEVFANITDRSRVEQARIVYTADGQAHDPVPMRRDDGTWYGRIPSFEDDTTIEFHVEATDHFGHTSSSAPVTFQTGNELPSVDVTSPDEGATLTGEVPVTWEATDPETPDSDLVVTVYYSTGQTPKPVPGAQRVDNTGRQTIDTTRLPNGPVTLQVVAFDGSVFGEDTVNLTVRNLASIFETPQLEGAQVEDGTPVVAPGEETVFTVGIDDPALAAWANVTRGGEVVAAYELEPGAEGTWRGTIQVPDDPGRYQIDLAAVTADGPVETEGAYSFEVAGEPAGSTNGTVLVILTVLFGGAVAAGAVGIAREWKL